MTYQSEIEKIEAPAWVEIYEFTVGDVINRYTSHDEAVTHNLIEYAPRPIERASFDSREELRPERLKVKTPLDDTMKSYIAQAPVEPVFLKITRVILDTGDDQILFDGEVIDVSLQDNYAEITLEGGTEIFKNEFPAFVYQSRCQWMLFDAGCTLLEDNFKTEASVTLSSNGTVLSASAFDAQLDGYFTFGYVRFEKDIRLITNHVGANLTLQAPFDSRLTDGKVVKAFPGCDKSKNMCDTKFNNKANHTGFANIPSRNPVVWGFEV